MAQFFDQLDADHRDFIAKQPVFFVATAARVRASTSAPRAWIRFACLTSARSPTSTSAGRGTRPTRTWPPTARITIMMCAFEQPALILRIYGRGVAVLPQDARWPTLAAHFKLLPGTRQIFEIAVEGVQTSCGWGVPIMHLDRERQTLSKAHARFTPDELVEKWSTRTRSIDGLPVRVPSETPTAA